MGQKGTTTTSEPLMIDDFYRLLEGLHGHGKYRMEIFCLISFCFALRVSDTLRLKWIDILDKDDILIQEGKTKKVRDISINLDIRKKIRTIYSEMGCPDPEHFICHNPRTGKPYSPQLINRMMKDWIYRYKLPVKRLSTHSFRKTFGRFVYENMGRTSEAVILLNRIFRHSSIEITMTYIGLRQQEIRQAYQMISIPG